MTYDPLVSSSHRRSTHSENDTSPTHTSPTRIPVTLPPRAEISLASRDGDENLVREGLTHPDPKARATALHELERNGWADSADIIHALRDEVADVRRRAVADAIAHLDIDLAPYLLDPSDSVAEQAAWAIGERHELAPTTPPTCTALISCAMHHLNASVREAAIASLGAIGTPDVIDVLVHAMNDKAPIRRRAVIGLSQFDDERARETVRNAKVDRDWQVRQFAEDHATE